MWVAAMLERAACSRLAKRQLTYRGGAEGAE